MALAQCPASASSPAGCGIVRSPVAFNFRVPQAPQLIGGVKGWQHQPRSVGPVLSWLLHPQEAYSVARQFNLIPPICEQAEYHMFQREKVEVQLPELFHKIGGHLI